MCALSMNDILLLTVELLSFHSIQSERVNHCCSFPLRQHVRSLVVLCLCCRLGMSAEENPAAEPAPVIDVQRDGRWMSQVCTITEDY